VICTATQGCNTDTSGRSVSAIGIALVMIPMWRPGDTAVGVPVRVPWHFPAGTLAAPVKLAIHDVGFMGVCLVGFMGVCLVRVSISSEYCQRHTNYDSGKQRFRHDHPLRGPRSKGRAPIDAALSAAGTSCVNSRELAGNGKMASTDPLARPPEQGECTTLWYNCNRDGLPAGR
jgi:hypothetical protein